MRGVCLCSQPLFDWSRNSRWWLFWPRYRPTLMSVSLVSVLGSRYTALTSGGAPQGEPPRRAASSHEGKALATRPARPEGRLALVVSSLAGSRGTVGPNLRSRKHVAGRAPSWPGSPYGIAYKAPAEPVAAFVLPDGLRGRGPPCFQQDSAPPTALSASNKLAEPQTAHARQGQDREGYRTPLRCSMRGEEVAGPPA